MEPWDDGNTPDPHGSIYDTTAALQGILCNPTEYGIMKKATEDYSLHLQGSWIEEILTLKKN